MSFSVKLAHNLCSIRDQRLNISQTEMGKRIGISLSTLSKIEGNKQKCPAYIAAKYAELAGCALHEALPALTAQEREAGVLTLEDEIHAVVGELPERELKILLALAKVLRDTVKEEGEKQKGR